MLPVLTGMMKNGLTGSSFSAIQEPQALVVAPTRELAVQINMDARKFVHGTMLRPVVVYGGTSVGYQLRQVEQGTHILVGTPGRLLDVIGKGKVMNTEFITIVSCALLWSKSKEHTFLSQHLSSPRFLWDSS